MTDFDNSNPEHLSLRYSEGKDLDGTLYRDFFVQPPMVKNELVAITNYPADKSPNRFIPTFEGNDDNTTALSLSPELTDKEVQKVLDDFDNALVALRGVTQVFSEHHENY